MERDALILQAAIQVPVLVLAIAGLYYIAPAFRELARQVEGLRADQSKANNRLVGVILNRLELSDPRVDIEDTHDGDTQDMPAPEDAPDPPGFPPRPKRPR